MFEGKFDAVSLFSVAEFNDVSRCLVRCCFPISFLFSRSLLCSMRYRCVRCCVRCAVRCATSAFCLMLCSFFTLLRRCCVRCCVPGATSAFCSMLFSFFTLLDALCSVRCCVPFYVAESLLYSMRYRCVLPLRSVRCCVPFLRCCVTVFVLFVRCCCTAAVLWLNSISFIFFTFFRYCVSVPFNVTFRCSIPFFRVFKISSVLSIVRNLFVSFYFTEYGYKIASCCSMKILHILTKP